jgi:LuxR family maltose regulon positive regulatory protein
MQGVIHLQRCEWEAAVEHLGRSVANRFIHHARAAVDSMAGLMLAHQALGQEDEAQATLQTLHGYVASLGDPAMESLALSAEARLAILQGRPGAASRRLEAIEPSPEGAWLWWVDSSSITRCRAMIAVGSPGSLAQAEAQLRDCAAVSEAQHNTFQLVKVLALQALACDKQGRTAEALGVLERAVTMASQGNVLFPFVELGTPMVDLLNKLPTASEFTTQVERVVTSTGVTGEGSSAGEAGVGKRPAPQSELKVAGRTLEGLSNRELDVLELLALRLQNKEIAARLNISPQTVGSHLKQIYQKLAVRGRRQAVERARERGVLGREPAG